MKINFSNINFKANKVSAAQAEYFRNALKNSKNVNIICHTGTDSDSACCAAVVASYLAQLGVKSKIIASKDISKLGVLNANQYNCIKEKDLTGKEKVEGTTICLDFSSKDRVSSNALNYIENANKLLCIDHHRGINIKDHDYVYINSPLENNHIRSVASCYMDSSAKSATSIVYRFLEALGEDVDNEKAYNLFLGLVDDASKRGYVGCSARTGEVYLLNDALGDKNFLEVYNALINKLSDKQVSDIAKEVDRTANLTPDQTLLNSYLYNNIQYASNNKIAYVVIEPDNKVWKDAGGDTPVVSTILNKFRQDILLNRENKKEFKNLEIAMVFYEANGNYRVSLHSKNKNLHPIYRYVENNCPAKNISIGGHTTRGGGRITSLDKDSQELWVSQLIEACKQFV